MFASTLESAFRSAQGALRGVFGARYTRHYGRKKGQRLHIQYVDGLWITAGTKLVSPDNAPHQYAKVVVIGVAEGKEEVVMIVPSGTKARPFSDALKKDYEQVFLRINDDVKSDNSGEVTYKATIK